MEHLKGGSGAAAFILFYQDMENIGQGVRNRPGQMVSLKALLRQVTKCPTECDGAIGCIHGEY